MVRDLLWACSSFLLWGLRSVVFNRRLEIGHVVSRGK